MLPTMYRYARKVFNEINIDNCRGPTQKKFHNLINYVN